jgi:nitroimidazol reductase NimA-like FMN-containing flavoprotein (pyridoxamine 5'-phosphate oxidase superfamily)
MVMELEKRAAELLGASEYINIATASISGEPWNTPVTGVHDQELNFYWSSWKEAQHSVFIRGNPRVFITLYDSTRKRGDNHRRCLYFQAEAREVNEPEIIKLATTLLYGEESEKSNFTGEAQRRIYKAVPKSVWLNDKSESQVTEETIKMRVQVSIDPLRQIIKS